MTYIKLENGTPVAYSLRQLRRDNPDVSFPEVPDAYTLAGFGAYEYTATPAPEVGAFERAVDDGFAQIDGAWVQKWRGEDATDDVRASMRCSRLQGRLVLGPDTCAALDAMAADPLTPWAMRETITNSIEWNRTSEAMTELGYLLGYTPTQMDDLFRIAMTVRV